MAVDKEMLEAMRAIVTENNQALKQEMAAMMDSALEPFKAEVVGRLDRIESDVSVLKSDVSALTVKVDGLTDDVEELKGDVAVLKDDVEELKEGVDILKTNQEYALKWIDRVEQRTNPTVEYFHEMMTRERK